MYLTNGDLTFTVAVGIKTAKTEPWKYKEFKSEENKNNINENEVDKGKYINTQSAFLAFFFVNTEALFLDKNSEDSSDFYEITGMTKSYLKQSSRNVQFINHI